MSYEIKLDIFEGPLDLLLYLIRKNEIDIYNIPIALITEQYLEYLDIMRSLNLDLAGEYLVLASTLIHIKSRLLLPPVESDGEGEEGDDPRAELVQQLLEYQAFKEAALSLDDRPLLDRDVFTRGAPSEEQEATEEEEEAVIEIGVFELVQAFRRIVAGLDKSEDLAIDTEKMSLADRINEIMERLAAEKQMTFTELLGDKSDRKRIVYTFLAILELMKLRMIRAYQSGPFGGNQAVSGGGVIMEEKTAIIEALIFASETPLTPERVVEILPDVQKKEIICLFEELEREYETRGGGIRLMQVAGGFQFRTRQDLAPWIRKLKASRPAMLSPAAMETLAVIAYRQPLVKAEIDRIRGVDVSGALKGLLDKKIVRIVGRKDVPGKPIIYGTTRKFLEVFNLRDLSELPTLRELKDLQETSSETDFGMQQE